MGNIKITVSEFEHLMERVAEGWNEGNARTPALHLSLTGWCQEAGGAREAADCFSEDALYVEPPEKQLYRGRAARYEFLAKRAARISP